MAHAWDLADRKELREELQKAIIDDPEVENKADISVYLETEGTKVSEIHIIGSVGSEKEKQRVAEIVSVNTRNEVEVINELLVK
jgi:hypothetical protein